MVTVAAPTDGDGRDSVWMLLRDDGRILSCDYDHALHLEYLPSYDAARRRTEGVNGGIDFVW